MKKEPTLLDQIKNNLASSWNRTINTEHLGTHSTLSVQWQRLTTLEKNRLDHFVTQLAAKIVEERQNDTTWDEYKTLKNLIPDTQQRTKWLQQLNRAVATGVSYGLDTPEIGELYDWVLAVYSTGKITPDQLHQLGQQGISTPKLNLSYDWQSCEYEEIRPSDLRVKAVFPDSSIVEGTPQEIREDAIVFPDGVRINSWDTAEFYRLPDPDIVHPDPKQHHVIWDRESNGFYTYDREDNVYRYVFGPSVFARPSYFYNWDPAELEVKNEQKS